MNNLISIGTALLFLGIFLIFLGTFLEASKSGKTENKVAIGGFIGFIPFGFANDKRLFWVLLAVIGTFLTFWVVVNFRFFR